MNEGCEGENSRMTPGFFAYTTGRMALPLVEMGTVSIEYIAG